MSIDFYGPLLTPVGGVKYILTAIDVFSNTLAVINKIFKDYIVRFGKPVAIMMGHGTQFTSKKWTDTLRENGIKLIFSSIRHPQSNIVERIHSERATLPLKINHPTPTHVAESASCKGKAPPRTTTKLVGAPFSQANCLLGSQKPDMSPHPTTLQSNEEQLMTAAFARPPAELSL